MVSRVSQQIRKLWSEEFMGNEEMVALFYIAIVMKLPPTGFDSCRIGLIIRIGVSCRFGS